MGSATVMVMMALPLWLVAGTTITFRLVSRPPKRILPSGTRVGFEEVAERLRQSAGNKASPMVKEIGPADRFSPITWSGMGGMVGGKSVPGKLVTTMSDGALSNP